MKQYKTDFKLQVVQSFLSGEGGAKLLARRWSVPEEKIRTWVSHYRLHGVDGLRPKRSAAGMHGQLSKRTCRSDVCSG
jgi:transposase